MRPVIWSTDPRVEQLQGISTSSCSAWTRISGATASHAAAPGRGEYVLDLLATGTTISSAMRQDDAEIAFGGRPCKRRAAKNPYNLGPRRNCELAARHDAGAGPCGGIP